MTTELGITLRLAKENYIQRFSTSRYILANWKHLAEVKRAFAEMEMETDCSMQGLEAVIHHILE